jgi:hypothetical protein
LTNSLEGKGKDETFKSKFRLFQEDGRKKILIGYFSMQMWRLLYFVFKEAPKVPISEQNFLSDYRKETNIVIRLLNLKAIKLLQQRLNIK